MKKAPGRMDAPGLSLVSWTYLGLWTLWQALHSPAAFSFSRAPGFFSAKSLAAAASALVFAVQLFSSPWGAFAFDRDSYRSASFLASSSVPLPDVTFAQSDSLPLLDAAITSLAVISRKPAPI